jgi:hypothetical protein
MRGCILRSCPQCLIAQPASMGRMMWDIVIVLALLYVGGRG